MCVVREVCDWIEAIGMGQYRKKFAHNCINGRLMLSLTDSHLKMELGIGPLGHRILICDAIAELAQGGDIGLDIFTRQHQGRSMSRSSSRANSPVPNYSRPSSSMGIAALGPNDKRPRSAPSVRVRRPASASPKVCSTVWV